MTTNDCMTEETLEQTTPCPYVYARGRKCKGHIVRIEAFKADLAWVRMKDGVWAFDVGQPRSHYHLYCSEKDNHAGFGREDALKYYYQNLPEQLRKVVATDFIK